MDATNSARAWMRDTALLAATGREQRGDGRRLPGDTGTKQAASGRFFHSRSLKGNTMKTLKELRDLREQKAARMTELVELTKSESRGMSDEEATEFDTLETDVKSLDGDIREARLTAIKSADARPVDGSSSRAASASRGGMSFVRTQDPDDKFKGQSMTRVAIAKAAAYIAMKEGNFISAGDWAERAAVS